MEVDSLRPELGLELFKLILLRENYLKKLAKKLKNQHGFVELGIIGLLDLLRETSIQVVRTTELWEKAQVAYPIVKPFTWNSEDYLIKMTKDTDFLQDFPQVSSWLGFSTSSNPFLVPNEILSPAVILSQDTYVVFGRKPDKLLTQKPSSPKKKNIKSPYTTPIINDPEIFTNLSAKSQLDKKFKGSLNNRLKRDEESIDDPYQIFISAEVIEHIRKCTIKLEKRTSRLGLQPNYTIDLAIEENDANFRNSNIHETSAVDGILEESTAFESSAGDLVNSRLEIIGNESEWNNTHLSEDASKHDLQLDERGKFLATLKSQSEFTYQTIDKGNESHRLMPISESLRNNSYSNTSNEVEPAASLQYSQLWTPHEIHLQRQVQRRGGEMYVLTAAGVKGRMRAPRRKTRFERMEFDVDHLRISAEEYGMAVEDLESQLGSKLSNDEGIRDTANELLRVKEISYEVKLRKKFMDLQYNHFKKVAENGVLVDMQRQRQLHKMEDGQAREPDQQLSINLEDAMIRKVQILVRKKFGRALRKVEIARRQKAALRIQSRYRAYKTGSTITLRARQLRLALIVQQLYRKRKAWFLRHQLIMEAMRRASTLVIQRVYRGYLGRKRLNLKRRFIKALQGAKHCVSIKELKPGDIEDLANLLDDYMRDTTIQIPIALLSLLRGILFMLNGDNSETVIVNAIGGHTEKKYIYARAASWDGLKLIFRRKGRLLRRLRGLIQNSCSPNASRIVFTDECLAHINALDKGISESDFDPIKKARKAIVNLFRYLNLIKQAYDLQHHFPDYFDPALPSWFRSLLTARERFDRAEIDRRVENKANHRIEEIKRMHARAGKKYSHIAGAVNRNAEELKKARDLHKSMRSKFKSKLAGLQASEVKEAQTLEATVRAKTLAVDIAKSDVKDYMRLSLIPDEAYIRKLHGVVDDKAMELLQAKTDLLNCLERNQRYNKFRDFDNNMSMKKIYEMSADLGKIKADLLILSESWDHLIEEIEGAQYIKDLIGERLERFLAIRGNALRLLKERRELINEINKELQLQYAKMYKLVFDTNLKFVLKKWDEPSIVEDEFEDAENHECSKRDYDLEFRKRRQLEDVVIKSKFSWKPFLLIMDDKLPRFFIDSLVRKLRNFEFSIYYFKSEMSVCTLQTDLQHFFDEKRHVIVLANRQYISYAKVAFDALIASVVQVLIPRPKVVLYSAESCYSSSVWLERLVVDNPSHLSTSILPTKTEWSEFEVMSGKCRSIGFMIRYMMSKNKYKVGKPLWTHQSPRGFPPVPAFLIKNFKNDIDDYFASLMSSLASLKKDRSMTSLAPLTLTSKADLLLAANISILWGIYSPIVGEWTDREVIAAAQSLRTYLSKVNFEVFCDNFVSFNKWESKVKPSFYSHSLLLNKVMKGNERFPDVWAYINSIDLFYSPARATISKWIKSVCRYLELSSSDFKEVTSYDSIFNPTFPEVIQAILNDAVIFSIAGDILSKFLDGLKVLEVDQPFWKVYYDKKCVESLSSSALGMQAFETSKTTQSKVFIFHHGDDILVGLDVINQKVDQQPVPVPVPTAAKDGSKVSVTIDPTEKALVAVGLRKRDMCRFYTRISNQDLVTLVQPNYTEIFEGKVKRFTSENATEEDYYRTISTWVTVDSITGNVEASIIRSRFLILSKLGYLSGYFVRIEVYEERFAEIRLLVFGLPATLDDDSDEYGSKIFQLKVDRNAVYELIRCCDEYVEKNRLEAFDASSMAYIYSNRLRIEPSANWCSFLNHGELLPHVFVNELSLKLRVKSGPGRHVGRQLVNLRKKFIKEDSKILNDRNKFLVLMSIFEIENEQQSYELRVVLYHIFDGNTVEFRISSLERIMLFNDEKPIIQQIIDRLKLSYCCTSELTRVLMPMPEFSEIDDTELNLKEYEVAGDDEFSIRPITEATFAESKEEEDNEFSDTSDDLSLSSDEGKDAVKVSPWSWNLYFDRSPTTELRGNLVVSVVFSASRKGFQMIIFDPRTFMEAYHFVSFSNSLSFLGMTPAEFEDQISNLDESVAFELIEEMSSKIDITNDEKYGHTVQLLTESARNKEDDASSDSDSNAPKNIILAYLKEIPRHLPKHPLSKKQEAQISYRIYIDVLRASNIAELGVFSGRNCFCIVRYNMREVGRTPVICGSLNPDWTPPPKPPKPTNAAASKSTASKSVASKLAASKALANKAIATITAKKPVKIDIKEKRPNLFEIFISKAHMLQSCSIDIEVYDTDSRGRQTDFLGLVKLSGLTLLSFLSAPESQKFDLQPSRRLTDSDNKFVQGSLELIGLKTTIGLKGDLIAEETVMKNIKEKLEKDDQRSKEVVLSALDSSNLNKFKYFDLFVTQIELPINLAAAFAEDGENRLECVIFFNHALVHRTLLDSASNLGVIRLVDLNPIECRFPDSLPIGLCLLRIVFYCEKRQSTKKKNKEKLGEFELTGESLKDFVRLALLSKRGDRPSVSAYDFPGHFNGTDCKLGIHCFANVGNSLFTKFVLQIRSARSLPKADLFGKSDPFVVVKLNGIKIGQTSHKKNTFDPNWVEDNQVFNLVIAPHWNIEIDCRLELQVFDYDNLSEPDLMGVVVLSGATLRMLLEPSSSSSQSSIKSYWKNQKCEYHEESNSVFIPLKNSTTEKQEIKAQGDLEIAILSADSAFSVPALQIYNTDKTKTRTKDENTKALQQELWSAPTAAEASLFKSNAKWIKVSIVSGRDLGNADLFGKSDPFVRIWFNGKYIGTTKTIEDSLNPVWNENYLIPLARGQAIQDSFLELEVYDEDSFGDGDFLGCIAIEGDQLQQLVLMNTKASSKSTYFELQKSIFLSESENKLVKGAIRVAVSDVSAALLANRKSNSISQFAHDTEMNISIEEPDDSDTSTQVLLDILFNECAAHQKRTSTEILSLGSSTQAVVASIVFNGDEWLQIRGAYNASKGTISWHERTARRLIVQDSLSLKDCHLEIIVQLENGNSESAAKQELQGVVLGGWYLAGDSLRNLFTPEPAAGDISATQETNMREKFIFLDLLPFLGQCVEGTGKLSLNISLRATKVVKSLRKHTASLFSRPSNKNAVLRNISTPLNEEQVYWFYRFPKDEGEGTAAVEGAAGGGQKRHKNMNMNVLDDSRSVPTPAPVTLETNEHDPVEAAAASGSIANDRSLQPGKGFKSSGNVLNKNANPAAKHTSGNDSVRSGNDDSKDKRQRRKAIRSGATLGEATNESVTKVSSNPDEALANLSNALNMFTKQMELPAAQFTVTLRSKNEEEQRVYWRGKVSPKSFSFASENERKAVFAARSSRLIASKNKNNLQVMTEVHYLFDEAEEVQANNDLPVCVREVVSEGPGLVTRKFRIEMLTNTGVLMGGVDILDTAEEIFKCIGDDMLEVVITPEQLMDRKKWDLPKIFKFIAEERAVIDMSRGSSKPAAKAKTPAAAAAKTGRRAAILEPEADEPETAIASVITLQRDEVISDTYMSIAKALQAEYEQPGSGAAALAEAAKKLNLKVEVKEEKQVKVVDTSEFPEKWLRIHSKTHRLTGKTVRSNVLIVSREPMLFRNADYYFRLNPGLSGLNNCSILFICKDVISKAMFELRVEGTELTDWVPDRFEYPDIITKFRRDKLGSLLLSYLSLKFNKNKESILHFMMPKRRTVELSLEDLASIDDENDEQEKDIDDANEIINETTTKENAEASEVAEEANGSPTIV